MSTDVPVLLGMVECSGHNSALLIGVFSLCSPPDPQPKDSILYYGFSTFALELNELSPDLKPLLPPTDTRLRPDQRWVAPPRGHC